MKKWNTEKGHLTCKYTCDDFTVFMDGFYWRVKNEKTGTIYAKCFKSIQAAENFAEKKMK